MQGDYLLVEEAMVEHLILESILLGVPSCKTPF